jgi:hypothetical protein
MPEFNLQVFQEPTGRDFKGFLSNRTGLNLDN